MDTDVRRKTALETIQQNIDSRGYHVYVVSGTPDPRFAYTIGLSRTIGFELVLAGGILYMLSDVSAIINGLTSRLTTESATERFNLELPSLGVFSLRSVHPSWVKALLLGPLDFYQVEEFPALQIVPDHAHWSIDIPNLSEPCSPATAPAWKWLKEPWTLPVPKQSMALTDMAALNGARVTEAMRWEDDYWELFAGAGPDVPKEDTRVVPLGLLLTADDSLEPIVDLPVGSGLWRDDDSDWRPWGKPGE